MPRTTPLSFANSLVRSFSFALEHRAARPETAANAKPSNPPSSPAISPSGDEGTKPAEMSLHPDATTESRPGQERAEGSPRLVFLDEIGMNDEIRQHGAAKIGRLRDLLRAAMEAAKPQSAQPSAAPHAGCGARSRANSEPALSPGRQTVDQPPPAMTPEGRTAAANQPSSNAASGQRNSSARAASGHRAEQAGLQQPQLRHENTGTMVSPRQPHLPRGLMESGGTLPVSRASEVWSPVVGTDIDDDASASSMRIEVDNVLIGNVQPKARRRPRRTSRTFSSPDDGDSDALARKLDSALGDSVHKTESTRVLQPCGPSHQVLDEKRSDARVGGSVADSSRRVGDGVLGGGAGGWDAAGSVASCAEGNQQDEHSTIAQGAALRDQNAVSHECSTGNATQLEEGPARPLDVGASPQFDFVDIAAGTRDAFVPAVSTVSSEPSKVPLQDRGAEATAPATQSASGLPGGRGASMPVSSTETIQTRSDGEVLDQAVNPPPRCDLGSETTSKPSAEEAAHNSESAPKQPPRTAGATLDMVVRFAQRAGFTRLESIAASLVPSSWRRRGHVENEKALEAPTPGGPSQRAAAQQQTAEEVSSAVTEGVRHVQQLLHSANLSLPSGRDALLRATEHLVQLLDPALSYSRLAESAEWLPLIKLVQFVCARLLGEGEWARAYSLITKVVPHRQAFRPAVVHVAGTDLLDLAHGVRCGARVERGSPAHVAEQRAKLYNAISRFRPFAESAIEIALLSPFAVAEAQRRADADVTELASFTPELAGRGSGAGLAPLTRATFDKRVGLAAPQSRKRKQGGRKAAVPTELAFGRAGDELVSAEQSKRRRRAHEGDGARECEVVLTKADLC